MTLTLSEFNRMLADRVNTDRRTLRDALATGDVEKVRKALEPLVSIGTAPQWRDHDIEDMVNRLMRGCTIRRWSAKLKSPALIKIRMPDRFSRPVEPCWMSQ